MNKQKIHAQIMLAFDADVNNYNPKTNEVALELNSQVLKIVLDSIDE